MLFRSLLDDIDKLAQAHSTPPEIVGEVRTMYVAQQTGAREEMDATAAQFPEFVTNMQERLAQRLLTLAQTDTIQEKAAAGAVPAGIADDLLRTLTQEHRELRGGITEGITVSPKKLLRKVPFFKDMPEQEFARIADVLVERSFPAGDTIVAQGARGASLYLIARGVVRVSAAGNDGAEHDLASLVAGDFFGEMAVLTAEPRSATCRAVTPCALYELRRTDFQRVVATLPAARAAVERANEERRRASNESRNGDSRAKPVA